MGGSSPCLTESMVAGDRSAWGALVSCHPMFQRGQEAGLRRSDHITDTLASFHWLRAPERVQYKLATVVYRSLNGTAPSYLTADLRRLTCRPGDVYGHHWPISWTSASRSVQLLEIEPSPVLVLGCGTVCQQTLFRATHFLSSAENLKHFCLCSLIRLFCFSFFFVDLTVFT